MRTVRGHARTLLAELSTLTGLQWDARSAWVPWALRHSAWLVTRCCVRANGRTAYEELRRRRYQQPLLYLASASSPSALART